MPGAKINEKLPQTKDAEIKDLSWTFNGKWMPELDAALIGAENYSILQNLRYRDNGLEGVSGYSKINTTALSAYPYMRNGIQLRTSSTQKTYTLVHTYDQITAGQQGRVYVNKTDIPDQGDFDAAGSFDVSGNPYFEDVATDLQGRFSTGPQGTISYTNTQESAVWAGEEMRMAAAFSVDDEAGTNPKDHTEKFNNQLQTAVESYTFDETDQAYMILMTTRPVQGFKFYISSANVTTGTMTIKYWNGTAMTAVGSPSDGTDVAGAPLAQTGSFTFTFATAAVPLHYEELYLYTYVVEIPTSVSADIYHITANAPFQDFIDVWDGVYRQPIQFQYNNAGKFEDYTLHVNESSDVNTPIGAQIDAMLPYTSDAAGDYCYIMFEKPMSAIKMTMLSGLVNTDASVLSIYYWDGDSWITTSATDGTATSGKCLGQTGLIFWNPQSDEQPQTKFGTYGYMYQLRVSVVLAGTKGSTEDVLIDICTGIPAQETVRPFKFPSIYKNRTMLCNYDIGNEQNRVDYCVNNAPDAWNGADASGDGQQSLFFGDDDPIMSAVQLYNRFGSNIFSMFLTLKQNAVYLMTGNTPADFTIFPVSFTIGCPAPLSLATAEVGFEEGGNVARNVAIWCSHAGPVLFDGAVLMPLRGIDIYFDPNETTTYINTDKFDIVRGWFDSTYQEYNLLLPSGAGQVTNNVWLVYDLLRKKWFTRSTGTAEIPQFGFKVIEEKGAHHNFGGIDTGYLMYLDDGTSYDGVGITQKIRTGDFFPSNNIWDECRLRKFKLLARRIDASHSVEIKYFGNTAENPGVAIVWTDGDFEWTDTVDFEWDSGTTSTIDLSLATGTERLVRTIDDLNRTGWAHAFEFEVTTSDTVKGFRPVGWGVQYYVTRKDDTAT